MKKATALILCLAMLFAIAPPSLAAIVQTAPVQVRQYGEEAQLVSDKDGVVATIVYPVGDVEAIDAAVLTWASLTLEEFSKKASAATADGNGIKGTLHVDYESHEHDGRFVGIEESGAYSIEGQNDGDVLFTYNYDLLASKPLTLFEVVDETHMDTILSLVEKSIAEQGVQLTNVSEPLSKDDMQNFVIRADGISWLFTSDNGIVAALLSYDALDKYLKMNDAPAPAPATAPAPPDGVEIEQTALCMHNGSHIRAEADQHSALIDTINANTELEVIKSNVVSGWHEIWYKDQVAYIAASLVQLSNQPAKTVKGFVMSDYVHIRAGAGTKYKLLGTLHYQDQVDILQQFVRPDWHKILYNGQVAYVCADYIAIGNKPVETPDPAVPQPTPAPVEISPKMVSFASITWTEVGTCTTNGVIVRSRESTRSDYYGKLHAGEQIYIIEYGDKWCRIYVPHGQASGYVGYAHTKYFEIATPEPEPASDVPPAQRRNPKTIISIA